MQGCAAMILIETRSTATELFLMLPLKFKQYFANHIQLYINHRRWLGGQTFFDIMLSENLYVLYDFPLNLILDFPCHNCMVLNSLSAIAQREFHENKCRSLRVDRGIL